jgi:hypothetical protein
MSITTKLSIVLIIISLIVINVSCSIHKLGFSEIEKVKPMLEPGDIMVERNDWRVSNLLYSGFWKHVVLYTGSLEEMDSYFQNNSVINTSVSEYLKQNNPLAYNELMTDKSGYESNMIESKKLVVRVGPMQDYVRSEHLAGLRPIVSKDEKLKAIIRALNFTGRPYDLLFNYKNQDAIYCSELVYEAYRAREDYKGINFELANILWAKALMPNDIAKKFQKEQGTSNQSFEFLFFISSEHGKNEMLNQSVFENSWKRFSPTILPASAE